MFKPILTKPVNDPFFITIESGGLNPCGKGKPTDPTADAMANCVSFVVGAFNKHAGETWCHYFGSMNAKSIYTVAVRDYHFPTSIVPKVGAIACWSGGKDGRGHVAEVEVVNKDGSIVLAMSGYESYIFKTVTVTNANGRWGMTSDYKFQGFVENPFIDTSDPKLKINDIIDNINNELEEIKELVAII